jgi:hypothetical protein
MRFIVDVSGGGEFIAVPDTPEELLARAIRLKNELVHRVIPPTKAEIEHHERAIRDAAELWRRDKEKHTNHS